MTAAEDPRGRRECDQTGAMLARTEPSGPWYVDALNLAVGNEIFMISSRCRLISGDLAIQTSPQPFSWLSGLTHGRGHGLYRKQGIWFARLRHHNNIVTSLSSGVMPQMTRPVEAVQMEVLIFLHLLADCCHGPVVFTRMR